MSTDLLVRSISRLATQLTEADLAEVAHRLDSCGSSADADVQGAFAGTPQRIRSSTSDVVKAWRAIAPDTQGAGIALALRGAGAATAAERRSRARLVWTGPDSAVDSRGTAGTVIQLVNEAAERLLILSYATYEVEKLDAALRAAAKRGVHTTIVLETVADSGDSLKHDLAKHFGAMHGMTVLRWPKEKRKAGAALHAKAVVADGRSAFVTSANLTGRAMRENIELGVLLADRVVARDIERHVESLRSRGELVPTEF